MFKRILLPTDGTPASLKAIVAAMDFAKSINATVVGLYVIPPFHTLTYRPDMLEDTHDSYVRHCAIEAQKFLDQISKAASEVGVACSVQSLTHEHPYEAIITTARGQACDLIAMASHGRRGAIGMLLGSETQKVLTHSAIPVLVYR